MTECTHIVDLAPLVDAIKMLAVCAMFVGCAWALAWAERGRAHSDG